MNTKKTASKSARSRRTARITHVALTKTHSDPDAHQTMLAQWEATRTERETFPPEKLRIPRVDLTNAVLVMQGACARVRLMKERVERAALPEFDMSHISRLETYCGAALYADALVRGIAPEPSPTQLLSAANAQMKRMGNAARSLADDGLFPISVLEAVPGGTTTRDTAEALRTYAATLSKNWESVRGNSILKEHDLAEAVRLANELLAYLERKDRATAPSDLHMERRKALVLALDAYEHVRRAVGWLRWFEGDADEVAPTAATTSFARASNKRATSDEDGGEGEKGKGNEPEGETKPAGNGPGAPVAKAGGAKPVEDKGPVVSPDRKPLVPQDDPLTKN